MSIPTLSIIVCTYNRDHFLKECLSHLKRQTASREVFEVLVIDNNSSDQTGSVCQEFQKTAIDIDFHYFIEPLQGLSYSRNLGLKNARASLVSYLDDDAYAAADYVENLCRYFHDHRHVDAIGGKIIPIYQSEEPRWMSKYLLPLVAALDLGDQPKAFGVNKYPIGANMAFRRSVLEEFGGFNTGLGRKGAFLGSGEEKDLFLRMKSLNKVIHYVPQVQVKHSIPEKRTRVDYIQRMAEGIGKSEALRLKNATMWNRVGKWFAEFFKIGATVILAIYYSLGLKWPRAKMLIKFRFWVLKNFIKGYFYGS